MHMRERANEGTKVPGIDTGVKDFGQDKTHEITAAYNTLKISGTPGHGITSGRIYRRKIRFNKEAISSRGKNRIAGNRNKFFSHSLFDTRLYNWGGRAKGSANVD